jgi:hypothetical protein
MFDALRITKRKFKTRMRVMQAVSKEIKGGGVLVMR